MASYRNQVHREKKNKKKFSINFNTSSGKRFCEFPLFSNEDSQFPFHIGLMFFFSLYFKHCPSPAKSILNNPLK